MPPEFLKSQNVSRETIDKLEQYQKLLIKWQRAINLVSAKTLQDSWSRHFIDSAQLLPYIDNSRACIADLGSGAGFPGLVLAMLQPGFDVNLIESDERKGQFLRTVSRETETLASVHTERIERAYELVKPDLITARALAALDKLLDWCQPWNEENSDLEYLFLKGAQAQDEIKEAQKSYDFDMQIYPSETSEESVILHLKSVRKKLNHSN